MTKFKIISNPYQKEIQYLNFDTTENEWSDVIKDPKYKGNLRAARLIHGFFPFVVEEVVETIIREFGDGKHPIRLYFEGTSDEYEDLSDVCQEADKKDSVSLQPIEKHLNNAYDILPDIKNLFRVKISPIISKSIEKELNQNDAKKIVERLDQFSDAAAETIPICVIGNYSAGKSTFINSLIGQEILPSGDKAVTARIFEIFQSEDESVARIIFHVDDAEACLSVQNDSFDLKCETEENELIPSLNNALNSVSEQGISVRVNKALSIINSASTDRDGSIIQIYIPFKNGLWNDFPGKFVILDTPGSNAASHTDHKAVLTSALERMSNGIPMYVAERDSLDSTDNEELYETVSKMDGLDPRFTMIIVNKADGANLPADGFSSQQTDDILNEAIPKKLRSNGASGIYFVSSIMGLGAKNNGAFIDSHYAETFADNEKKFKDPKNSYYKQLYKYDIMPDQIKSEAMQIAEGKAKTDPLFANSGLFTIEHAVQIFSSKYASYNKCQQAEFFLNEVIENISHKLDQTVKTRTKEKAVMEEKLENDKREMIRNIESNALSELNSYKAGYESNLKETLDECRRSYSIGDLKKLEDGYTKQQQNNHDLKAKKEEAKKQSDDVGKAIKEGFNKIVNNKPGFGVLKDVGTSLLKETREAIDSNNELHNASRAADQAAADALIHRINQDFYKQAEDAEKNLADQAQLYWTDCSVKFRDKLAEIVKDTSLSDKKKNEITELIVSYKNLNLDPIDNDDVFKKDEFDYLLNLGKLKLIKTDKILLNRLASAYKSRIRDVVKKINHNIYAGYLESFQVWEDKLVNIVRKNIVNYSPELKQQQKQIDDLTDQIHDLQNRLNHLGNYSDDIQSMINWKES